MDVKSNENEKNNKDSFETMILYRSLYILKRKFEIYKNDIFEVYKKFELQGPYKGDKRCQIKVNIDSFIPIMKEVFELINTIILPLAAPKDIFLSNLIISDAKKEQMNQIISQIFLFAKEHMLKYNEIFYEKKIKGKKLEEPKEENSQEIEMNFPIVEYNKKGKVVRTFNQLLNDNITNPIVPLDQLNNEVITTSNIASSGKVVDKDASVNVADVKTSNVLKSVSIEMSNFLYIETLPLIVAEYLQENPCYIITEYGNDLSQELSALFDKDIMTKIDETNRIQRENEYKEIMQIPQKKELIECIKQRHNVKQNIGLYEKLLIEKKAKSENTVFIEDMLEKLLARKIWLDHKIKYLKETERVIITGLNQKSNSIGKSRDELGSTEMKGSRNFQNFESNEIGNLRQVKSNSNILDTTANQNKSLMRNRSYVVLTKEEKRQNALKEIFTFYTTQHNSRGVTFDKIQEKKEHLDLAEFSKFCTEFNISITRQKLVEIFKKNTYNLRTMTFSEFLISLEKISNALMESKKSYIIKKISQAKEQLTLLEMKESQRQEEEKIHNLFTEKNTGGKANRSLERAQFNFKFKKKKLLEEISTNKYEIDKLERKSYQQCLEDFYIFLGLDHELEYRKKMKGFVIPFQTYDKQYRIPKSTLNSKLENNREISRIISLKKREKEKLALAQKLIKKDIIYQHKLKLFEVSNKKLNLNYNKRLKGKQYSDVITEAKRQMIEKERRLAAQRLKEEEERKNKISWDKLEEIDIDDLNMNPQDKEFFMDTVGSEDEELMIHLGVNSDGPSKDKKRSEIVSTGGNPPTDRSKVRLAKNNSAIALTTKTNKEVLPPLGDLKNLPKKS